MKDETRVDLAPVDRIAGLLGHGLSPPLVGQLVAVPRLRRRMTDLIVARMGDLGPLAARQAEVLALTPEALAKLALRVGLIWHAEALARIVDGEGRRSFAARFGEDAFRSVYEARHLAPADQAVDLDVEAIADAAPHQGAACLAAWCEIQPPPVATRLGLTRPEASPDARHRAWGPPLVAWTLDNR